MRRHRAGRRRGWQAEWDKWRWTEKGDHRGRGRVRKCVSRTEKKERRRRDEKEGDRLGLRVTLQYCLRISTASRGLLGNVSAQKMILVWFISFVPLLWGSSWEDVTSVLCLFLNSRKEKKSWTWSLHTEQLQLLRILIRDDSRRTQHLEPEFHRSLSLISSSCIWMFDSSNRSKYLTKKNWVFIYFTVFSSMLCFLLVYRFTDVTATDLTVHRKKTSTVFSGSSSQNLVRFLTMFFLWIRARPCEIYTGDLYLQPKYNQQHSLGQWHPKATEHSTWRYRGGLFNIPIEVGRCLLILTSSDLHDTSLRQLCLAAINFISTVVFYVNLCIQGALIFKGILGLFPEWVLSSILFYGRSLWRARGQRLCLMPSWQPCP